MGWQVTGIPGNRSPGRAQGTEVQVSFTPHLVPMSRGILSTLVLKLRQPMGKMRSESSMKSTTEERSSSVFYRRRPCPDQGRCRQQLRAPCG